MSMTGLPLLRFPRCDTMGPFGSDVLNHPEYVNVSDADQLNAPLVV